MVGPRSFVVKAVAGLGQSRRGVLDLRQDLVASISRFHAEAASLVTNFDNSPRDRDCPNYLDG